MTTPRERIAELRELLVASKRLSAAARVARTEHGLESVAHIGALRSADRAHWEFLRAQRQALPALLTLAEAAVERVEVQEASRKVQRAFFATCRESGDMEAAKAAWEAAVASHNAAVDTEDAAVAALGDGQQQACVRSCENWPGDDGRDGGAGDE